MSHAHRRENLPFHSLCTAQTFPQARLRTRMLLRMWQVNSHNPRSGHCPLTPNVYCTRLPGPPKERAVMQHVTPQSTPLSVLKLFFAEIITLPDVETNR